MSIKDDQIAHDHAVAAALGAAQAVIKNPASTAAQVKTAMIAFHTARLTQEVATGVSNGAYQALLALGVDPGGAGAPKNSGKVT